MVFNQLQSQLATTLHCSQVTLKVHIYCTLHGDAAPSTRCKLDDGQ